MQFGVEEQLVMQARVFQPDSHARTRGTVIDVALAVGVNQFQTTRLDDAGQHFVQQEHRNDLSKANF